MASSELPPTSSKTLILRRATEGSVPAYHDAVLEDKAIPPLQEGQVLVKINAAGFNARDLWLRLGMYGPGTEFDSPLGADGAGVVVATGDADDQLLNKRVFLLPMRGWDKHPDAPESPNFAVIGGTKVHVGTFTQYVVVDRSEVIPTPEHLDDVHAAAWPISGLTAWRSAVVYGKVNQGDNVLITGIGGGVAVLALQICLARGATVYVTSGSDENIRRAIGLGAKAGVNYKNEDWINQLTKKLEESGAEEGKAEKVLLSAVIDCVGGDIMVKTGPILKSGGRVVLYGMTTPPYQTIYAASHYTKCQQICGVMMGSRQDLIDATNFIAEHRVVPHVSLVLDGLEEAEEGFELMRKRQKFGKMVMRIRHGDVSA
ncbi:NAD(P)-binding protein [Fomitopsis serialis]|uniref:NAD(P)-binding protein n=1 Tax=Fomitopsis serialis TaxID=139415 RepID=UPI0020087CA8|nr:NAD(P)-binding protein [Neoantrodia serialis]KAH9923590.1 NAD(P)-binding protein [Neoantrodia serialis]